MKEEDTVFDAAEVKSALDKTVVLVGQAHCAVAHQRRLSVLEDLTSVSKAKSLLKCNKDVLEKEDKVLFGAKFEDHLEKTSKVSKKSLEYFGPSTSRNFAQPFPHPPPPPPQGGGGNQMAYTLRIVEPEVMEVEEDIQNQDIRPQIHPPAQEVSYHSIVPHPSLNMLNDVGVNVHQTLKDLFWEIKSEGNFAGRLKYYLKNWKKITNDPIVKGWEIKFWSKPHQTKHPHQINTREDEKTEVSLEIENMLRKGVIIQVFTSPGQMLSNIFLREKKNGKFRPIINLKKVNSYIPYQHFKMEGLNNVKELLQKGDYMVKIDLTDAYFSIPLHKNSRKFLRFLWEGKTYEFLCLCFGLGPAPRIFTKLMKVSVS